MPSTIARCSLPPSRIGRGTAALVALVAVAGLGSPVAEARRSAKKKAPSGPSMQASFEQVLDAQKPAVVSCVMEHGITKGADSVMLDIKVLVNRQGQVFSLDLQVNQKGGDKDAMSACVKQALNTLRFPSSRSALTELRRQWTFATTQGPGAT